MLSEPGNLDPTALERLQRLGGDPFVCKMIDLFVDYAGKKIAEARAAYLAGESAGVEQAVHPLKSSAGNVGAARIQALGQELEILAKQGQLGPLGVLLDQLEQAFLEVKPELEQKRKQHSISPG